jgi:hypothetical protein
MTDTATISIANGVVSILIGIGVVAATLLGSPPSMNDGGQHIENPAAGCAAATLLSVGVFPANINRVRLWWGKPWPMLKINCNS